MGKGEGGCFQRNNRNQSQLDEQGGNIKDDIKVSGVVMTAALTETGSLGLGPFSGWRQRVWI